MNESKYYIHINNRKRFKSGGTTQIKTGKTTAKKLKVATKNPEKIQSKRQHSDGIITIAGNKQRLWMAAPKKLWAHQKIQQYRCTLFQSTCRTCLFNRQRAKRSITVKKTMPTVAQTNASTHQVNQTKKNKHLKH